MTLTVNYTSTTIKHTNNISQYALRGRKEGTGEWMLSNADFG